MYGVGGSTKSRASAVFIATMAASRARLRRLRSERAAFEASLRALGEWGDQSPADRQAVHRRHQAAHPQPRAPQPQPRGPPASAASADHGVRRRQRWADAESDSETSDDDRPPPSALTQRTSQRTQPTPQRAQQTPQRSVLCGAASREDAHGVGRARSGGSMSEERHTSARHASARHTSVRDTSVRDISALRPRAPRETHSARRDNLPASPVGIGEGHIGGGHIGGGYIGGGQVGGGLESADHGGGDHVASRYISPPRWTSPPLAQRSASPTRSPLRSPPLRSPPSVGAPRLSAPLRSPPLHSPALRSPALRSPALSPPTGVPIGSAPPERSRVSTKKGDHLPSLPSLPSLAIASLPTTSLPSLPTTRSPTTRAAGGTARGVAGGVAGGAAGGAPGGTAGCVLSLSDHRHALRSEFHKLSPKSLPPTEHPPPLETARVTYVRAALSHAGRGCASALPSVAAPLARGGGGGGLGEMPSSSDGTGGSARALADNGVAADRAAGASEWAAFESRVAERVCAETGEQLRAAAAAADERLLSRLAEHEQTALRRLSAARAAADAEVDVEKSRRHEYVHPLSLCTSQRFHVSAVRCACLAIYQRFSLCTPRYISAECFSILCDGRLLFLFLLGLTSSERSSALSSSDLEREIWSGSEWAHGS